MQSSPFIQFAGIWGKLGMRGAVSTGEALPLFTISTVTYYRIDRLQNGAYDEIVGLSRWDCTGMAGSNKLVIRVRDEKACY